MADEMKFSEVNARVHAARVHQKMPLLIKCLMYMSRLMKLKG